jgi:hypothetical protein
MTINDDSRRAGQMIVAVDYRGGSNDGMMPGDAHGGAAHQRVSGGADPPKKDGGTAVTAHPGGAVRTPLHTLLGDHPTTHSLRQGLLTSPTVPLTFADVAVPNNAFKRVVRDLEFDVAELALMTFLMARSRGAPLRLLPVVVFSRNPLPHLVCDLERGCVTPEDLPARRIAVRSYTTTTAVWIRALLGDEFGVSWDVVNWTTLEEGHVAGVADPANVQRAGSGTDLMAMLRAGVVDAAIVDPIPRGRARCAGRA